MSLEFPNSSRYFDASKSRINFWGYDRTIEVSYFIGADVLKRFSEYVGEGEAELLKVFDANIETIHKSATAVYSKRSNNKGSFTYVLINEDF